MLQSVGDYPWGLQSSICPSMELIGTLDLCYIKVCVLIILYALLPFGAPVGAPHLVGPAPVALSHQNRSPPPKIGPPGPILAKKLPKMVPSGPILAASVPPDRFWQPKIVPLCQKCKFGKHMLAKISPPSKTESLYPVHVAMRIDNVYYRLSSSYS